MSCEDRRPGILQDSASGRTERPARRGSTIKDLPAAERPRERLLLGGTEALSTRELLAVVLGSGTKGDSALVLADNLLARFGDLRRLGEASAEEISQVRGIGPAKAARLRASLELARRLNVAGSGWAPVINSAQDAALFVHGEMRFQDRECLKILMLNTRRRVVGTRVVSIGDLSSSPVHPREVFKEPVRRSSASILLVHNHPSGDPTPSDQDVAVTRRLQDAGKLLGIQVLDHVIVGDNSYVSLAESGLLQ